MTVKLTKEARLKIPILYLDGVTAPALEERFNVHASTIAKTLKDAGIETPKMKQLRLKNAKKEKQS